MKKHVGIVENRSDVFLSLADVCRKTMRSRSSLYLDIAAGRFPKPLKIGEGDQGRVVWLHSDFNKWLEDLINKREQEK